MRALVLAWMLGLAPRAPMERLAPIADAIAAVATTRADAAVLVAIDFEETGLGAAGAPFGFSCCYAHHPERSLADWAARVLRIHRGARSMFGRAGAFYYWNSGNAPHVVGHSARFVAVRARALRYAARCERVTRRLLARAPRRAQQVARRAHATDVDTRRDPIVAPTPTPPMSPAASVAGPTARATPDDA